MSDIIGTAAKKILVMAYHPLPITWYVIFYILGIFYYPDHQNQWTPDFHFIERQWPCWTEEGEKARQNLAKKEKNYDDDYEKEHFSVTNFRLAKKDYFSFFFLHSFFSIRMNRHQLSCPL